ncbi:hypothetical protein [Sphingobium sp. CFD-2]|nr:hypothetical protein [Sphingobium sp. CFD-2]
MINLLGVVALIAALAAHFGLMKMKPDAEFLFVYFAILCALIGRNK